jgi:predicted DNA-binding protein (MmcQ/YjbR family)
MNIERIREICLQMPHTSESIKYGDQLCFMVAGKSFCSAQIHHLERIKFKVPDEDFEELCDREGITPAPYGGARFKWVQVEDFPFLTEKEWQFFIHQSYKIIKSSLPKKVLSQLDDPSVF